MLVVRSAPTGERRAETEGNMVEDAGGQQMVADGFIVLGHFPLNVEIEQVLLLKTQIPVFDVLHLLIDDDGANDEGYRNDELRGDEPFADETCAASGPDFQPFQHGDRIKGGEIEGRVAAREQAAADTDRQQANEMSRGQWMKGEVLVHEVAECGQGNIYEKYGQKDRKEREHQGFEDEPADERLLQRAKGLADADFPCTLSGAGRSEVHEVDARDEQDDRGDERKELYKFYCTAILLSIGEVVIEMPVIHRPEEHVDLGIGHVLGTDEGRELPCYDIRFGAGFELQDGRPAKTAPGLEP